MTTRPEPAAPANGLPQGIRAEMQAALRAERDRLEATRAVIAGTATDQAAAQDLSEVADALVDRGDLTAEIDRIDEELVGVGRALDRLAAGTYGICGVCGGPIGVERLRAVPAAERCMTHQLAQARPPSAVRKA